MKSVTFGCVLLAGVVPTAAASAPPGPIVSDSPTLAVSAAPDRAGTKPVALTLRFRLLLRCASPGLTPITVTLPLQERVPRAIGPAAVLVDGSAARAVSVAGRRLVITPAVPHGALCNSITVATLNVVVTRAARLGNPRRPGTYMVSARRGALSFRVPLAIRP